MYRTVVTISSAVMKREVEKQYESPNTYHPDKRHITYPHLKTFDYIAELIASSFYHKYTLPLTYNTPRDIWLECWVTNSIYETSTLTFPDIPYMSNYHT